MKIIDGFKLRTVMGQSVVVGEGARQINFSKLISLNESAALLWQKAEGRTFTDADLAEVLVEHYGIDRDTALADVREITSKWLEHGLVEP